MFKVTACTTGGHLLDLSHQPETLESANQWARELAAFVCIRHVVVSETNEAVIAVHHGKGFAAGQQSEVG